MKRLLNTLFVMTEDAYLALENDNVVIHQNEICGYAKERSRLFPVGFSCRRVNPYC